MATDYDFYSVIDPESVPTFDNRSTITNTPTITTGNTYSIGDYYYPYTSNYWWYTSNVYYYQIFCPKPRCRGKFWGTIGSIVACPKCSSRVKITDSPPADYEVEVT